MCQVYVPLAALLGMARHMRRFMNTRGCITRPAVGLLCTELPTQAGFLLSFPQAQHLPAGGAKDFLHAGAGAGALPLRHGDKALNPSRLHRAPAFIMLQTQVHPLKHTGSQFKKGERKNLCTQLMKLTATSHGHGHGHEHSFVQ